MGTDIADLPIDNHIADALRHAMLMHGDSIIEDPELFEILRDHGAFHSNNCSDDITRMIIDNGTMSTLLALSHRPGDEIIDGVDKEVCKIKYMCSFHEKDIRKVVMSLVKGMNMNLDIKMALSNDIPISDTIEIDPDDLIEPPSCPIPPRKPKGIQTDSSNDIIELKTSLKDEESSRRKSKKRLKSFAALFGITIAIVAGVYIMFHFDSPEKTESGVIIQNKSTYIADTKIGELKDKLKRGSSGQQVTNLVIGLCNGGYLTEDKVTNVKGSFIYDENVENAVGHFQKDLGIRQDGVYDTKLDEILFTFWRPEYSSWGLGKRKLSVADPKAGADIDLLIEILREAGFPPDSTKLKMSEKRDFTEKTQLMFQKIGSSKGEEMCRSQHYYYSKDIENRLMDFQTFNGIKPTGELDAATIRALSERYLHIKERQPSSFDARPTGLWKK